MARRALGRGRTQGRACHETRAFGEHLGPSETVAKNRLTIRIVGVNLKSKSIGDPDAGNLLVQGDNLEALAGLRWSAWAFGRFSSFGSRSDLSLRQRRNDGSDSRQLSILQSRLQLLEGSLDFRWRPAIALIDEQSDYVIDFVRNGACCHFDLL